MKEKCWQLIVKERVIHDREITIRFQENANRKAVDYKINEFPKF